MRQTPQKNTEEIMNTTHDCADLGHSDKRPENNLKSDEMRDQRNISPNLPNAPRALQNAPDATEKTEEILDAHTRLRGFWAFGTTVRN